MVSLGVVIVLGAQVHHGVCPDPGTAHGSLNRIHYNRLWWIVKAWLIAGIVLAIPGVLLWHVPLALYVWTYPVVTVGPLLVAFVYAAIPPQSED